MCLIAFNKHININCLGTLKKNMNTLDWILAIRWYIFDNLNIVSILCELFDFKDYISLMIMIHICI